MYIKNEWMSYSSPSYRQSDLNFKSTGYIYSFFLNANKYSKIQTVKCPCYGGLAFFSKIYIICYLLVAIINMILYKEQDNVQLSQCLLIKLCESVEVETFLINAGSSVVWPSGCFSCEREPCVPFDNGSFWVAQPVRTLSRSENLLSLQTKSPTPLVFHSAAQNLQPLNLPESSPP